MSTNSLPKLTGGATGDERHFERDDIDFFNGELALFGGVIRGPVWLPDAEIDACKSYREAVRLCWVNRRIQEMPIATMAYRIGGHSKHATDWIKSDDKPTRRSLPAKLIHRFEGLCGNRGITQWLARRGRVTIMEEMIAKRAA